MALIAGPALGVVICDLLDWRWIFGVLLLAGALTAIAAIALLPGDERAARPVIPVASIAGWFILVFGLVLIGEAFSKGLWVEYLPLIIMLTAIGISVFAFAETRKNKLFDYTLFRYPAFRRGVVSAILLYLSISVIILFMPFYLEDYEKLSTGMRTLFFSLSPISTVFAGPLGGHLADRIGFRVPILSGLFASTTGLLLMSWAVSAGSLWVFGLALTVVGLGNGMFSGPNFSGMMGSVSSTQRSVASGMSTLTRNIGFLVGISLGALVFGILLSVVGGRELMVAARMHQLESVVPYGAFAYAFSRSLLISAGLLAIALLTVLRYPNRVEPTEATG